MSYNITSREFDPITRTKEITEGLGLIVRDLLSSATLTTNPYFPVLTTIGLITTYSVEVELTNVSTNIATTNIVTFTSTGTETVEEVMEGLQASSITSGFELTIEIFPNYTDDVDKYFTFTANQGFRISAPPILGNIAFTMDKVQAPTNAANAYLAHGDQLESGYPRLTTTILNQDDSTSRKYNKGTVELDLGQGAGLRYYPYEESYLQFDLKVTVESGAYELVLGGEVKGASYILNQLHRRLRQENRRKNFIESIDATFKYGSVIPSPKVAATNFHDLASCTFTFDLVDRYVELSGDVMESVEIEDSILVSEGNPEGDILIPNTTISRNI